MTDSRGFGTHRSKSMCPRDIASMLRFTRDVSSRGWIVLGTDHTRDTMSRTNLCGFLPTRFSVLIGSQKQTWQLLLLNTSGLHDVYTQKRTYLYINSCTCSSTCQGFKKQLIKPFEWRFANSVRLQCRRSWVRFLTEMHWSRMLYAEPWWPWSSPYTLEK